MPITSSGGDAQYKSETYKQVLQGGRSPTHDTANDRKYEEAYLGRDSLTTRLLTADVVAPSSA